MAPLQKVGSVRSDPSRAFLPGSYWRAKGTEWVRVAPWGEVLGGGGPAPDPDVRDLYFKAADLPASHRYRNPRPLIRLSHEAGNRFAIAAPLLVAEGLAAEVAPEGVIGAAQKRGPLVYAAGTLWSHVAGMVLRINEAGEFLQGIFPITEGELREFFVSEAGGEAEGGLKNYLKLSAEQESKTWYNPQPIRYGAGKDGKNRVVPHTEVLWHLYQIFPGGLYWRGVAYYHYDFSDTWVMTGKRKVWNLNTSWKQEGTTAEGEEQDYTLCTVADEDVQRCFRPLEEKLQPREPRHYLKLSEEEAEGAEEAPADPRYGHIFTNTVDLIWHGADDGRDTLWPGSTGPGGPTRTIPLDPGKPWVYPEDLDADDPEPFFIFRKGTPWHYGGFFGLKPQDRIGLGRMEVQGDWKGVILVLPEWLDKWFMEEPSPLATLHHYLKLSALPWQEGDVVVNTIPLSLWLEYVALDTFDFSSPQELVRAVQGTSEISYDLGPQPMAALWDRHRQGRNGLAVAVKGLRPGEVRYKASSGAVVVAALSRWQVRQDELTLLDPGGHLTQTHMDRTPLEKSLPFWPLNPFQKAFPYELRHYLKLSEGEVGEEEAEIERTQRIFEGMDKEELLSAFYVWTWATTRDKALNNVVHDLQGMLREKSKRNWLDENYDAPLEEKEERVNFYENSSLENFIQQEYGTVEYAYEWVDEEDLREYIREQSNDWEIMRDVQAWEARQSQLQHYLKLSEAPVAYARNQETLVYKNDKTHGGRWFQRWNGEVGTRVYPHDRVRGDVPRTSLIYEVGNRWQIRGGGLYREVERVDDKGELLGGGVGVIHWHYAPPLFVWEEDRTLRHYLKLSTPPEPGEALRAEVRHMSPEEFLDAFYGYGWPPDGLPDSLPAHRAIDWEKFDQEWYAQLQDPFDVEEKQRLQAAINHPWTSSEEQEHYQDKLDQLDYESPLRDSLEGLEEAFFDNYPQTWKALREMVAQRVVTDAAFRTRLEAWLEEHRAVGQRGMYYNPEWENTAPYNVLVGPEEKVNEWTSVGFGSGGSQWSHATVKKGPHLGKEVAWKDLPPAVQEALLRYADAPLERPRFAPAQTLRHYLKLSEAPSP